jgi:cyanate lyase
MNDSVESGAKDPGVIASQRESEVTKDLQGERVVADSPFGSASAVPEKEAVRELAPILDLPESETPSVKSEPEHEAPASVSAAALTEEEAVRELAPILDLPEPEIPSVKSAPVHEAPTLESAPAPAEEYELPRMAEPVVEAPAPEVTAPTMSAEQPIVEDPMFGPLKRLLVDLVGEG